MLLFLIRKKQVQLNNNNFAQIGIRIGIEKGLRECVRVREGV